MTHPSELTAPSRPALETMIWAQSMCRRQLATVVRCSVGKCNGVWTAHLEWKAVQ